VRLMISNKSDGARVRLGGAIQPSDREEAIEKLHAALDMGETLSLDLSGLGEIDTAALQILLCIRKEALRQNKGFRITAISENVQKAVATLRLEQALAVTPI